MPASALPDLPRVTVASRKQLRRWLEANHSTSGSIWLVTWKKSGSRADLHVPYRAIVEEALCFGWIDSRPARLDADRTMVLLSPRRAGSAWSAINKALVEKLQTSGRMHAAGMAAVERAKADGTWTLIDQAAELVEPPDLTSALAGNEPARRYWDAFPRSTRRAILEWIIQAKRPETRARRIFDTVRLAAENIRANTPAARQR